MPSYSHLTIHLDRLRDNIRRIQNDLPQGYSLMPILKARAYGTDPYRLARCYEELGSPLIGVAHVDEAIALREEGICSPLFVISAPPFVVDEVIRYQLQPSINTLEELEMYRAQRAPVSVHLNLNAGLNRFGLSMDEAIKAIKRVQQSPWITLIGCMTHLSKFDQVEPRELAYFEQFLQLLSPKPRFIHLGSSPRLLQRFPKTCNMVRVGLLPFDSDVLELKSKVLAIHTCSQGEYVGYRRGYQVKRESERIAILGIGYHDGLKLEYSGKGYVWLHGKRAHYRGYICMDFMMVDVTDIPEVQVGNEAEIFGENITPDEVAGWTRTNVRELLTSLSPRIERRISDAPVLSHSIAQKTALT